MGAIEFTPSTVALVVGGQANEATVISPQEKKLRSYEDQFQQKGREISPNISLATLLSWVHVNAKRALHPELTLKEKVQLYQWFFNLEKNIVRYQAGSITTAPALQAVSNFPNKPEEVTAFDFGDGKSAPVSLSYGGVVAVNEDGKATIGRDVQIAFTAALLPGVSLGDYVTILGGAVIGPSAVLEEYVGVGNGAVIGAGAVIKNGSTIGDGAVIMPGKIVGQGVEVSPEAVVTEDLKEYQAFPPRFFFLRDRN